MGGGGSAIDSNGQLYYRYGCYIIIVLSIISVVRSKKSPSYSSKLFGAYLCDCLHQ